MCRVLRRHDHASAVQGPQRARPLGVCGEIRGRAARRRGQRREPPVGLASVHREAFWRGPHDAASTEALNGFRESEKLEIAEPPIRDAAVHARQHFYEAPRAADERAHRVRAAPIRRGEVHAALARLLGVGRAVGQELDHRARFDVRRQLQAPRFQIGERQRAARDPAPPLTVNRREFCIEAIERPECRRKLSGLAH